MSKLRIRRGTLAKDSDVKVEEEIGTTGLRHSGGTIVDEFLRDLSGGRKFASYREMADNDVIISGVLTIIDLLQAQREWSVVPADAEDPLAVLWAERLATSLFEDLEHSFAKVPATAITDSITFGMHISEMVFKKRADGLITFKKFAARSPETLESWVWDWAEDRPLAVVQQNPNRGVRVTIPLAKCLHVTHKPRYENPEGTSALRGLYTTYKAVSKLRTVEGIGYERNVAGMPIMEVPLEILSADRDSEDGALYTEIKKLIQQIKRDEREGAIIPAEQTTDAEGRVIPTGFKFRFANAAAQSAMAQALHNTIVRLETHMARGLLAEFSMMGSADASGSRSMHEDKTGLFALFMDGLANRVKWALNSGPIKLWGELNKVPPEALPSVEHAPLQREALDVLSTFVKDMVLAGIINPTPELEGFMLGRAGLPGSGTEEVD
jgi:hypothetical protein